MECEIVRSNAGIAKKNEICILCDAVCEQRKVLAPTAFFSVNSEKQKAPSLHN